MAENTRRRNVAIVLVAALVLFVMLLTQCPGRKRAAAPRQEGATPPASTGAAAPGEKADVEPASGERGEVLTAATVKAPAEIGAGSAFAVEWTGPDNPGDFVTIVRRDASNESYDNYRDTKEGPSLELTAPIEPGAYEVRYVTAKSRTVLARVPVEVVAVGATLDAPAEVVLGSEFTVTWTGPDNEGDYITIVPKGAPDDHYDNYTDTDAGSPLTLTAPTETGEAEVRYVAGQGRKVLARRAIRVVAAEVTLDAPDEAVAGTTIEVAWTGPDYQGDYITVVPDGTPDGEYDNYTNTSTGSPLRLLMPIMTGGAELRYMTGQGNRVLERRSIRIIAAQIELSAAEECEAGADVTITWKGPNNPGDYITIVPRGTPEDRYADYANTSEGSPLTVKAPKEAGEAEIRYVAGQGNKVLARISLKVR